MKKLISVAVLLVVFMASRGTAFAGAAIFKNNVLTASHVTPPGTHVALIPPRNGVLSGTFAGFELPDRGKIEIAEKSGVPYKETEGTLTAEGVEAFGITLKDKSPVNLNGQPATLVSGISSADDVTGILLLVLGNERMTINVYGFYDSDDKTVETAVRNSLLSCIFNPSSVKSASGNYSLSAAGTSLKFSDEVGAVRYFTTTGQQDDSSGVLYTSTTADESVPREDRQSYAESAIGKFLSSYEGYSVISTRSVNYGGLAGIETIAEFDGPSRKTRTASGASVTRQRKGKAYQVLLFNDDEGKIYVFSGIATIDPDLYVSQFAKITSTFAPGR